MHFIKQNEVSQKEAEKRDVWVCKRNERKRERKKNVELEKLSYTYHKNSGSCAQY